MRHADAWELDDRGGDMTGRAVIIHSLDHARAALAAAERFGTPVTLYSAEGAAGYAGATWFLAVVAAARADHPTATCEVVLDCGTAPGLALAALRAGCRAIVIRGEPALLRKIAAIAAASSARLDPGPREGLDLSRCPDPEAAVLAWLAPEAQRAANPARVAPPARDERSD